MAVDFLVTEGGSIASISNSTIELNGETGAVAVQASQAGNENYNAAVPVTQGFVVTLDPVLGINESGINISVSPNPATEKLTVAVHGNYQINRVELISSMGKIVMQEPVAHRTEHTLNIQDVSKGIYLIRVYTNSGAALTKVMVLR